MSKMLMAVGAMVLTMVGASANALTYSWSFMADMGTSLGEVTGTISGLEIGSNDGTGLTIEVLTTPSRNILGGEWRFKQTQLGGHAFFVETDKTVTFADAFFKADGGQDRLYFGGYGGYIPQIISLNESDGGEVPTLHKASSSETMFNPPAVPLPAGLPLLLGGLAAFGAMRLSRQCTA